MSTNDDPVLFFSLIGLLVVVVGISIWRIARNHKHKSARREAEFNYAPMGPNTAVTVS